MNHLLREGWFTVDVPASPTIALVIDASESARDRWADVLSLALGVRRALPPDTSVTVSFLGESRRHPGSELEADSGQLYRAHCNRLSVIGPLLDGLSLDEQVICVAIVAGYIFDLEDWEDSPVASRLVVANFDGNTRGGDLVNRCEPTVAGVLQSAPLHARLSSPARLEIAGPEVMPFYWDNPRYKIANRGVCAEGHGDYRVHVGVLHPEKSDVQATAMSPDGQSWEASMMPCRSVVEYEWTSLSASESKMVHEAVTTGTFECRLCGSRHVKSVLRCPNDQTTILGRWIYPFLAAEQSPGFFLLRKVGVGFSLAHHRCAALRVGEESVIVRDGAKVAYFTFDYDSRTWRSESRSLDQYAKVGDDTYALVV